MQYLGCVYTKKSYKLFIWNSTLPEHSVFYLEILPLIWLWFLFWPWCVAYRISVPQPGIKPVPPAVKALSPNHWTTREFSSFDFLPVPSFPSLINELDSLLCIHFTSVWQFCAVLSHFSHVWLCLTLWTVAHQAPLSMGFSRQEYWCGLPCPPPGDLPHPGIEPMSPALQTESLPLSHWVKLHESLSFPLKKSSCNSMPVVYLRRGEIEK